MPDAKLRKRNVLAEPYRTLGRQVRLLRSAKGWTQEELAERAHLHVTYLSGVERGRRNPTLAVIAQLARALDVPPSELLGADRAEALTE